MGKEVARSAFIDIRNQRRRRIDDDENEKAPRARRSKKDRHADWAVDGVMVSDHAVVRYLQHVLGVDVSQIRKAIVEDGRADIIRTVRSGKFPIGKDGARLVVRDGLVVTIVNHRNKQGSEQNGAARTSP